MAVKADDETFAARVSVGSSPAAITSDGLYVWVANYGSNTISAINPSTFLVVATLDVGAGPVNFAYDGSALWVVNLEDDTVSVINAEALSVRESLNVGTWPAWAVYDGRHVWISNRSSNSLSKFLGRSATPVDLASYGAAAAEEACSQANGLWEQATLSCTGVSNYNCLVGGLCSEHCRRYPNSSICAGTEPSNRFKGHTANTEPALSAGCAAENNDLWENGKQLPYWPADVNHGPQNCLSPTGSCFASLFVEFNWYRPLLLMCEK